MKILKPAFKKPYGGIWRNSVKNKGEFQLVDLTICGDERGSLIALEELSQAVPFEIKRVYYIFGTTPDVVRGKHAHYHLKQLLICTSGNCDIDLDDGAVKHTVHMDTPRKGLLLNGFLWREMKNFSPDCVLMVLASEHYDEADYVRNYAQFLEEINK